MDFQRNTLINYFGAAGLWLLSLAAIGFPMRRVLARVSAPASAIPAAVYGMGGVMFVSWWWAVPGGGVRSPLVTLTLIGAGASLVLIAVDVRRHSWKLPSGVSQRAGVLLFCFVILAGVTWLNEGQAFTFRNPTVISLGNNDAPSYALQAQHLLDRSPDDPGGIVNNNIGQRGLAFGFGSYASLAHIAAVTDQDVWKVMQPALFALVVLIAITLGDLLSRLLGSQRALPTYFCCVVSVSSFYPRYLIGNWFFGQLLGVLFMLGLLAMMTAATTSLTNINSVQALRCAAASGPIVLFGLLAYPPMSIVGAIVLAPATCLFGQRVRAWGRIIVGIAGMLGGAGLVSFLAAPGAVRLAVRISKDLTGEKVAGWRIPVLWPIDLLGMRSNPLKDTTSMPAILSAVLLAILCTYSLLRYRSTGRSVLVSLVGLVVLPLGTYLMVNVQEHGTTYRLFKWVAFFIIPLVASILLLAFYALEHLWRRFDKEHFLNGTLVAAAAFPIVVYPATISLRQLDIQHALYVTHEEELLASSDALSPIDTLQVATSPYWDTMWIAYFLRDKRLFLTVPTYYPESSSPSVPVWQLERVDTPADPAAEVVSINNKYRLRLITAKE